MLDSRYLYLHEAMGLGPMWLSQTAYLIVPESAPKNTETDSAPAPTGQPVSASTGRQQTIAATQTASARKSIPQAVNQHRAALQQIINQSRPATVPEVQIAAGNNININSNKPIPDEFNISFDAIPASLAACTRCNLHQERCTPLPGYGASNARLLVVSSNPAPPDDSSQQLFSGEVGKLLNNMLAAINMTTEEVFYTSQVKCAPNVSLHITAEHLHACLPYLSAQIEHIRPQAVLLLGQIFGRLDQNTLAQNLHNIPFVICPHPARLLRQSHLKATAWAALKQLRNYLQ
jgi:uracil-DNA glycosylase